MNPAALMFMIPLASSAPEEEGLRFWTVVSAGLLAQTELGGLGPAEAALPGWDSLIQIGAVLRDVRGWGGGISFRIQGLGDDSRTLPAGTLTASRGPALLLSLSADHNLTSVGFLDLRLGGGASFGLRRWSFASVADPDGEDIFNKDESYIGIHTELELAAWAPRENDLTGLANLVLRAELLHRLGVGSTSGIVIDPEIAEDAVTAFQIASGEWTFVVSLELGVGLGGVLQKPASAADPVPSS